MTTTQTCTSCGESFPITREFFGSTPSGGFRRKCRTCMAEHTRAHSSGNPEMKRARAQLRRVREGAAGPGYSDGDIAFLREAQKDRCAYCDVELNGCGHVDHMTPLAQGGSNARDNLVLACFQCNTEKHAKTAHEYFWWRSKRGLPLYPHAYAYRILYDES